MEAFSVEKSIKSVDQLVKKLFDYIQNNAAKSDAYSIEREIQRRVMEIGKAAMESYFAERGTGDVGGEIIKEYVIFKKQTELRRKDYFSIFGKIKVPRSYYYAKGHNVVFPLDAEVNMPERCYSYLLQEYISILGVNNSFGETSSILEKILGINIKTSRAEVVIGEAACDYDAFYRDKKAPEAESEGGISVIGCDGKGVPVIKKEAAKLTARKGKGEKRQKKKEALVGVSYTADPKPRTAREVADNLVYPERNQTAGGAETGDEKQVKAQNIRRMASLERSKKEVMREIIHDSQSRDVSSRHPLVVVMDGALGLWNLAGSLLVAVPWVGILDIIHVSEYLWEAGNCLFGEGDREGRKWVHKQLVKILEGRVGRVIGALRQILTKRKTLSKSKRNTLNKVIRYFNNHKDWMRYDKYLAAGYPIGSGVVESACAHTVKDRMERAGCRWSIDGAESVLLLRSIHTSGDWESYWKVHMDTRHSDLYENTAESDYATNVSRESKIAA